jgi:hypothetical protein
MARTGTGYGPHIIAGEALLRGEAAQRLSVITIHAIAYTAKPVVTILVFCCTPDAGITKPLTSRYVGKGIAIIAHDTTSFCTYPDITRRVF